MINKCIDCNKEISKQGIRCRNCTENNLITLCGRCNSRVNYNRKYWTKYFQDKNNYAVSQYSKFS